MPTHPIPFFFHLQHSIKLYHWMTMTYSRHMAADALHEKLSESIDSFVETFIGKYGRPKLNKKELVINVSTATDTTIVNLLDDACKYLMNDISSFIGNNDTDLYNIRDEILGHLNQTKYLFTLQ